MTPTTNPTPGETGLQVWSWLVEPLRSADWFDWRGFWLGQICDDRFVVCYFLVLVPLLLLTPRAWYRHALVLTGLLFVGYIFGALYLLVWLASCMAFYLLGEHFARAHQGEHLPRAEPAIVVGVIIVSWYVGSMVLDEVLLPDAWNVWLHTHAPWVFPLGSRGFSWEPVLRGLRPVHHPNPPAESLLPALFFNAHSIGTAYLAVRMLHYFAELRRRTIPAARRTPLHFLAYTCYGPTLIQGPIERYARFHDEMDTCHARRGWHNVPAAVARMALGLIKSLVAQLYFQPVLREALGIGHDHAYYRHPEQIASLALLYAGVFLHIFWLYLEFSGYCDVAAGIGRLLGYRQVENFRMPWLATSMRDFWRRWHISLSFLLRDYVYIPLGGNRRHHLLNLCVTFFLVGIWHRLSPQVGLWGIVMGLLVAINHAWVVRMGRIDAARTSRLGRLRALARRFQPLPQLCAWLVTQHAFVFSLLVFFGGSAIWRVPVEIMRRLWSLVA